MGGMVGRIIFKDVSRHFPELNNENMTKKNGETKLELSLNT